MRFLATLLCLFVVCSCGDGDHGHGSSSQKITMGSGGFHGPLDDDDWFGFAVAPLGDFDNDGDDDLVVGAGFDDDGGPDRGAVWLLMLDKDGKVTHENKISDTAGDFGGGLSDGDIFGRSIASLGDLDGDGVTDLAVGSRQDDDGGLDRGAIWILFLNRNATVKSYQKISSTSGGFDGELSDGDWFGISVTSLGDLDGDGVVDLAAGAVFDDGGVVWILFLNDDGTVKSERRFAGKSIGATGLFGESVAAIGDVDGDGVVDLAVGEIENNDGGTEKGAVWILFLDDDGSVDHEQKISATSGNFPDALTEFEHLGAAVGEAGDFDRDGTPDLLIGADLDDDGGTNRGAVWLASLRHDGTVKSTIKISDASGGFALHLQDEDRFGRSVAKIGSGRHETLVNLAVGTIFDDDGGSDRGAVWNLFVDTRDDVAQ
ncbi:MAG TPA: integrin alpha [Candidatus Limnocylindrales bacterium]|nr:integrin alpha [Candidatus Limnocylindrales bacterium]